MTKEQQDKAHECVLALFREAAQKSYEQYGFCVDNFSFSWSSSYIASGGKDTSMHITGVHVTRRVPIEM